MTGLPSGGDASKLVCFRTVGTEIEEGVGKHFRQKNTSE